MPYKFLEDSLKEMDKTATVNQTVYDFALDDIIQKVSFFEKQTNLVETVHNMFITLPPEVKVQFNAFIGDRKLAALQVICRKLDPEFLPPWTNISLLDMNSLLLKVESMLQEISDVGMNSPVVNDFFLYLGGTPLFLI
jgi:hypothetical protein